MFQFSRLPCAADALLGSLVGWIEQAAVSLLEAAQMLARQPEAMQLRYLQTLTQIAGDKASTIVFPVPLDTMAAFFDRPR